MKWTIIPLMLLLLVSTVIATPDFKIFPYSATGTAAWTAQAGEPLNIYLDIVNEGDAGEKKVEVGIYAQSTVEDWYGGNIGQFFSLFSVVESDFPNCESHETNVDTKLIQLSEGEHERVRFTLQVPFDWNEDYYLHATAYDNCYNVDSNNMGVTDIALHDFTVLEKEGSVIVHTCVDGIQNQGETHTDCGGPNCPTCNNMERCAEDSDCKSAYCQPQDKICMDEPTTPPTGGNGGGGATGILASLGTLGIIGILAGILIIGGIVVYVVKG